MTPNEFVIWLRGFVQASSNFTLTPKQFDDLKEQLDKVKESNTYTIQIGTGGTGVLNTTANINGGMTYNNDVPTTLTTKTTHDD
jgi:alcohol dehydrogenase YqhD (iron-dependent ADH family)